MPDYQNHYSYLFSTTEASGMRSLHEIPVAGFEVLWMLEGFQLS